VRRSRKDGNCSEKVMWGEGRTYVGSCSGGTGET